jgi:hypothetical protein
MKSQMVRSLVDGFMMSLEQAGVVEVCFFAVVEHVRRELIVYGRHELNNGQLPMFVSGHLKKDHWKWNKVLRREPVRSLMYCRTPVCQPMVIEVSRDDVITLMFHAELVTMGNPLARGVSKENVEMAWKIHERLSDVYLAMTGVDTHAKLEI